MFLLCFVRIVSAWKSCFVHIRFGLSDSISQLTNNLCGETLTDILCYSCYYALFVEMSLCYNFPLFFDTHLNAWAIRKKGESWPLTAAFASQDHRSRFSHAPIYHTHFHHWYPSLAHFFIFFHVHEVSQARPPSACHLLNFFHARHTSISKSRISNLETQRNVEKMGSLGAILTYPGDIYPLLKLKMADCHPKKQLPPEPRWVFCYTLLHKASRDFSLVVQQLDTRFCNAIYIYIYFYLVLQASHAVEDDTRVSHKSQSAHSNSFLSSYMWLWLAFCMWCKLTSII